MAEEVIVVCRCVSYTVMALYQIKMGLAAAKEIIGLKPPDKVKLITIRGADLVRIN